MNANIAILGTANSGKTNFISEAIKDINTYAPVITIVQKQFTQIADEREWQNNQYILKAYENVQWEFSMCDYNGDLLKSHGDNCADLVSTFYEADTWIVLIDGAYFFMNEETDEKIIEKIKRYSARILLPYISNYAEMHNEVMPELLFVVTKANNIIGKFTSERIKYIVLSSYEGLFTEDASPMILLSETSSIKTAGLAILVLFYIRYAKEIYNEICRLENSNNQISNEISGLQSQVYEIENHKMLSKLPMNQKRLKDYEEQISYLRSQTRANNTGIEQCRNDMGLKHLGTCVQCLIDHNPQMIINGFERINYQYDKTIVRTVANGSCVKPVLKVDICILGALLLYLIIKVRLVTVYVQSITLCIMIILMFVLKKPVERVIMGGFAAIWIIGLCMMVGHNGLFLGFGYIALVALSVIPARMFEKIREKNAKFRFLDEMVHFFDTKAKERK